MPYLCAVLVGVASLAFALVLAMRRLRTAEDRIASAVARKQAQVGRGSAAPPAARSSRRGSCATPGAARRRSSVPARIWNSA